MARLQRGQVIETKRSWFLRYYTNVLEGDRTVRKQQCVKLCEKSDKYRFEADLEELVNQHLDSVNKGVKATTASTLLSDFLTNCYFPWVRENRAAVTANGYEQIWSRYLKARIGDTALIDLKTERVTAVLTELAKSGRTDKACKSVGGLGSRTLSHIKWFMSGIYQHAIALGLVRENPVIPAKWLHKTPRPRKQTEYKLEQVLTIIRILEPIDLRAALAVGLCCFAALRPAEARGLRWEDWSEEGETLDIKRSIWRNRVGDTKTEESATTVPVIEPLRRLLARMREEQQNPSTGYILASANQKSLSLDSLNYRLIAPILKKHGINYWRGYYPGRRGISSLVTDLSKNPLNSTGVLRHSNPVTALQHYTKPQADSIKAAMAQVEALATKLPEEPVN
jgi:integrase